MSLSVHWRPQSPVALLRTRVPSAFEANSWIAVAAPKHTPTEIIDKLNTEINAGLTDPKIVARLTDLGSTALTFSPADLDKFVVDETEKWGKVVRAAGIKAE
jgi:tripartite-type tricarboxylate transporter receptor subunit TctC